MATRGRAVLTGSLHYGSKRGNGSLKKKKVVAAFCGLGEENRAVVAQIQIYDDYEKVERPGSKPKNTIKLDGAKIESNSSSPSISNANSPAYSSAIAVSSPSQGGHIKLSTPPSNSSSSDLYLFTIATSNGDVHEFRTDSENDRLRWVKLLQLLVMYPYSVIPEEPKTNPIKDSFRQGLEAKQYNADSVWPVYILPQEVGTRCGMIGQHILTLKSGIPNVSMGKLEIISPTDHTRPVVTWDRDKMRRTGKTGHLVFIEIGRRCEGGPGLIWMYTGYQNDSQALRETLHKFLFHGDGSAIVMKSQPQSLYDVPRSSFDSLPNSSGSLHKRNSIPSGYHNHLLTRSRSVSQDHDSGYHSVGIGTSNGRTPPQLEGPPVRLDKHPSIRRKRDSDPGLMRSNSIQSSISAQSDERELSEPSEQMFECDELDGDLADHMDDPNSIARRMYDTVPLRSHSHPCYSAHAPNANGGGDEYMHMIHPKFGNEGYVYMKPVVNGSGGSPGKSASAPASQSREQESSEVEYNTLQHFPRQQSQSNSLNYEALPTITERGTLDLNSSKQDRDHSNYENHPLPQDLKGVMPRVYRPNYENQEDEFRGRRGSHGRDCYENMQGNEVVDAANSNGNNNNSSNGRRGSSFRRRSDRENVSIGRSSPSSISRQQVAAVSN